MLSTRDKIVQDLKEKLQPDHSVVGLLLVGSSLDDTRINKNSDLDFIVVTADRGGRFEFYYDNEVWVEIFYEDEERIEKCFADNDEIMINCFREGKIIIDTRGTLARLKKLAENLGKNYKLSDYSSKKLRYRFQVMTLKIKNAYLERSLEKMVFLCAYALPYLIRGVYVINHNIPPTLSLWCSKNLLSKLRGGELAINLLETLKHPLSDDDKAIDRLYEDFTALNDFLNSEMGGALREWRDERKPLFQTFL